jgi:hypothetical protein
MAAGAVSRRVLIPEDRILRPSSNFAAERRSKAVIDLIYIVVGIAVLGVFGLYSAALRRI